MKIGKVERNAEGRFCPICGKQMKEVVSWGTTFGVEVYDSGRDEFLSRRRRAEREHVSAPYCPEHGTKAEIEERMMKKTKEELLEQLLKLPGVEKTSHGIRLNGTHNIVPRIKEGVIHTPCKVAAELMQRNRIPAVLDTMNGYCRACETS